MCYYKYFTIAASLCLMACGGRTSKESKGNFIQLAGAAQGTTYHITYEDLLGRDFQNDIENILLQIDQSMSTYDESSMISHFNKSSDAIIPVDDHFLKVLRKSFEVYYNTNKAFDPTIKPLINLWGFGTDEIAVWDKVDSSIVDSMRAMVDFESVTCYDENRKEVVFLNSKELKGDGYFIKKKNPGVMLDFNAIAQGYTVDAIAIFLEDVGVTKYLVEVGGEMKVKGVNQKGEKWRVGIDQPKSETALARDLQAILSITDMAIATSGNYRKFYVKDNIKYSHTIDPISGYPVQHKLLSATVLTDDCMDADAYATAFMVMGYAKSREYLETNEALNAYLIYANDDGGWETFSTRGMETLLQEVTEQ